MHAALAASVPSLTADDERAIGALVTGYACALDARDWEAFRALFLDTIELDYGAIGSLVGPIDADAWTRRCHALGGFDATLHRITNLRVTPTPAGADADSYVDALHFIAVEGETLLAHLAGRYRHAVRRGPGGRWRIAGCRLEVAGYPGGQAAFARAFAAARTRHAEGQS